jgi:phosphate transport system substrate-binding protein
MSKPLLAALSLLGLWSFACSKKEPTPSAEHKAPAELASVAPHREPISLNGAGATFPFPLYSKWIADYNQLHPNVKINYQSIGSGGGIRQVTAGTVDFGATDAPMTEDELKKVPRKLLHIPTTLGSVVVTYHLDGVSQPLRLTPAALAGIYLGTTKQWNAPEIAKQNPGVQLPATDIAVVYRSDGSGTTAVFTDYLNKVSSEFKDKVGQGKSVKWPTGLGAKGNEGVTGQVKTTPNSVGYVELVYAVQNQLPTAAIQNAAGNFVVPSIAATTAAAAGVELSSELVASITNANGADAYPISSYTYLLVFEELGDKKKGAALADFLWWAMHDGQKACEALGYSPLPSKVVTQVEARIKGLTIGDQKALSIR